MSANTDIVPLVLGPVSRFPRPAYRCASPSDDSTQAKRLSPAATI